MNESKAECILYELSQGKTIGGKPYSFGHIKHVALLASSIAKSCGLDPDKAYVFGLLHDIGRFFVIDDKGELIINDKHRHPIEGYFYLKRMGYDEEARICITHAFIGQKNIYSHLYTEIENKVIYEVLEQEYDQYDLLIQLADEMSVMNGWCTLESRLAREALENGYNYDAWERFEYLHKIKIMFDKLANIDIYSFIMHNILFA